MGRLGEMVGKFVPERLKSRVKSSIAEQVIKVVREKGVIDFVRIEPSSWLSRDDTGRSVEAYGMIVQFDTRFGKEARFGRVNEVSSSHLYDPELNLRNILTAVKLQQLLAGEGIVSKIVDHLEIDEVSEAQGKFRFVPVIMEGTVVDGLVREATVRDLMPFPLA